MTPSAEALEAQGFQRLPGVLDAGEREQLRDRIAALPAGAAGERDLLDHAWCQALARRLRGCLPVELVAVQCTLFEKSSARNWLVTPHQDLAIPVAARVEHAALRGWSLKAGRHFVLAPGDLLARMLALRLHLDDATTADGGLRFVPGSHRDGVLDDASVRRWRETTGEVAGEAWAGDALLMHPLVLHASSKAVAAGRRRVLHFLFGPRELPYGLRWALAV